MLAMNIDVNKAVEKTLEIAKMEIEVKDKFAKYAPIYMAPTGNVKSTIELYKNRMAKIDHALVVGAQGAFAYELALQCETKKIDCFDKNILQYMFFALYDTAIKTCEFKEFIRNFTSITRMSGRVQQVENMLSEWLFFDLVENMKGIEKEYWSKLYKKVEIKSLIGSNLFRMHYPLNFEYLQKYSSVYNEKTYYQLQKLLLTEQLEINYHICEIDELHKEFPKNNYNLVMFDNVLQYYKSIPVLDNVTMINKYIKEKWLPLLKENGQIQLGYGFEVVGESVKQILNSAENSFSNDLYDLMKKSLVTRDIKEGFIANIVQKYYLENNQEKHFQLDFIPAVEENDGHNDSENVILTYKK